MTKEIKLAISNLSPALKIEHDKCLAKGYKDEHCPKCNAIALAHHHFIDCSNNPCPMSNGKTFLDMFLEYVENKENVTL